MAEIVTTAVSSMATAVSNATADSDTATAVTSSNRTAAAGIDTLSRVAGAESLGNAVVGRGRACDGAALILRRRTGRGRDEGAGIAESGGVLVL